MTAPDILDAFDAFDAFVACGSTGSLQQFNAAAVLAPSDVHVAYCLSARRSRNQPRTGSEIIRGISTFSSVLSSGSR